MQTIVFQLLVQVILILINAFFAATEIAVISLNANKLRKLEEEGDKLAPKLLHMVEDSSGFLSTIQIAITLSGFLGAAFAGDAFAEYLTAWLLSLGVGIPASVLDTISLVVVTIILSYFTLVFGELVPKRIAMQKSMEMARLSCRVVSAIATIAKPVVKLLSLSTNGVLRLLRMKTDVEEEQVTEDEIRMMIDLGNESGSINEDEKELLHNVFDFSDQTVSDVMTHAADVESISVDATREEVLDTIRSTGLSRFPVYGEDESDILGVLNTRDFLVDWVSDGTKSVRDLMRPAYLVPESLSADDLLRDMQIKKIHLAVVLDEYGGFFGVVTLKDLLEQLVGEFQQEGELPEIQALDNGIWRIQGSAPLDDVAQELGVELPEEEYDTFGGYVFNLYGSVPQDGRKITLQTDQLQIQMVHIQDHRLEEALVTVLPKKEDEAKEKDRG